MILVLSAILALYSFALRSASGGLTAVDPSRLAPMKGATGFTSPQSLEKAVAVGRLGSLLSAALACALLSGEAHRLWGWTGFAGAVAISFLIAYPVLEILPLLYTAPRGGRRLMMGIVAFAPIRWPLGFLRAALHHLVERLIPGPGPTASRVMAVRREALGALSDEARDDRRLRAAQKQLVTQVYEFGESTVEEVMVPRSAVVGIPGSATVGDAVKLAEEHQFSRYPVFRETLDQVEGVIHIYDLLQAGDLGAPITASIRPILFAPEGKKCDELLGELRKASQHAAMVVDEFGGTAGWVTVEDLLEELVGEIEDEHDEEEEMVRTIGRRAWVVDARIKIDDLNRAAHLEVPEGDYETLAGYLLEQMERIPRKGDVLDVEQARFEVTQADERRIHRVRIQAHE